MDYSGRNARVGYVTQNNGRVEILRRSSSSCVFIQLWKHNTVSRLCTVSRTRKTCLLTLFYISSVVIYIFMFLF